MGLTIRSDNMDRLPEKIEAEEALDELLSRPDEALVDFVRELDGDILVLGAGGKVGPTMARMARRAADAAGRKRRVLAVDVLPLKDLDARGVETIRCDLLDPAAVEKLPRAANVIFMAGRKFGSTGGEHLTWAINVAIPHNVARTFTSSRIAAFSTGCVYPVMQVASGGATEATPADPVGEYAMSCLGRERMFDYVSRTAGAKVALIRLNYAVELRYGLLADVAARVLKGEPVDVTTGFANVIWQGDACRQIIRSLGLASSPPAILNVTGPETFSIRQVAERFGELMGRTPVFAGEENGRGYLSNAARANGLFGNPSVPLARIVEWTADWVQRGGANLGKPTHFETQDGKY
jgi:nucleoside-diphosphate-sugar epimerase